MQLEKIEDLCGLNEGLYTKAFTGQLPFDFHRLLDTFGLNLREEMLEISFEESKAAALNSLYAKAKSKNFVDIYHEILLWLRDMLKTDFVYQPNPTFRIQWPGQRAGFFHVDSWVGHGPSTINIWIPLTELTDTSTVWMASSSDTNQLKKQVLEEKLRVSEYEQRIWEKMSPQLIPLGSYMTFNDNILHGSVKNQDELPRISFDFRIATSPFSIGVKKIGIDYVSDIFDYGKEQENTKSSSKCKSIVSTQGRLSHLSHVTQRAIINDFCKQNNLMPEMEASEFYTMDHFPQIMEWIELERHKPASEKFPIVIASKECFKNSSQIIKMCQKEKIKLYDALENSQLC